MKKKKDNKRQMLVLLLVYTIFVMISFLVDFSAGKTMGKNFFFFAKDMLMIFPPAFILVGLFMVWVNREIVEKYFGEASGIRGYLAAIVLASTTMYPFVIVIPMAAALAKKGARTSIVMTYLGANAVCRVPMTVFEASFIGIKFTIIRYVVSLPIIITTALLMEKFSGRKTMTDIEIE